MITDYIDNVIESIDERIRETEEILEFLHEQRRGALGARTGRKAITWFYVVKSRSGGYNHLIMRSPEGVYSCNCPAGLNGLTCWAVKGVTYDVARNPNTGEDVGRPWLSMFSDERGASHLYGFSDKSWRDAERNI